MNFNIYVEFRWIIELWPRVVTTSHFRNDALHCVIVPEISLRTLHPVRHAPIACKVLLTTVLAAEETLSGAAVGNLCDRLGLSYSYCSGWRFCDGHFCDRLRHRAGSIRNIIISLCNATHFLWELALVVQVIPLDAGSTLMRIRDAIRANVILLAVGRVGNEM